MKNSKEIISEMANISSVLLENSIKYYIPDFQRSFVWGEEEIDQLINDFNEDTENFSVDTGDLEGYLLGNIVLIDKGKIKIVVDGQQRLTTLSLFAKAIHSILNKNIMDASEKKDISKITSWSKRIGEIEKGFCILDDSDNKIGMKIEHAKGLSFGDYYRKLIESNEEDPDRSYIMKEEDANIDIVYSKIYEFLNELSDEKFMKFIQYYKTKIKLIITSAPTEEKAFQLFEILNDRGRSLEPMDLIKNLFLKVLASDEKYEKQTDIFNKNWQEIMKNLQLTSKKKVSSSKFLKQYLMAFKGENIKTDKLFIYFKNNIEEFNGEKIIKFVENMNKISQIYREIEKGNYSAFLEDQNMYILFKVLKVNQFHPLLMLLYNAEVKYKEMILDSITRFGASIIFSYTQTNYIEKVLPVIIKDYWKNLKDSGEKYAYNKMNEEINENIKLLGSTLKANLEVRNFVGKNGNVHTKAIDILKFIELYLNQNTNIITPPKGKKITVEHILSRNLDMSEITNVDLEFNDDKEKKEYIHRLGNLTLLYGSDNSSASNKKYVEKKEMYKNSNFILTSTLVEPIVTNIKNGRDTKLFEIINKYEKQYDVKNENWTKSMIDYRSKDLALLIEKIVLGEFNENLF